MNVSDAVRKVIRENPLVAKGNTGLLYFEVCRVMEVKQPEFAPDPGTVYRTWLRYMPDSLKRNGGLHE